MLNGSWTIWTGASEGVFSMMQPKVSLPKLGKNDKKYDEEGSA
jgi:hypothetical protein